MGVVTTTGVLAGVKLSTMAMVANSAMGAVGALKQGQAQAAASQTQAALYERQAQREREIGALNAKRQRQAGEKLAATQRALLAAGGGDPSTGSALLIQEDLAGESEMQARLAESNAEAAVSAKMSEAVLARAEGRNAKTASYYRAGTTLLKGAEAWG